MKFWKMNGAGNDFIIVDNINGQITKDRWPEIVKLLCERHMSIGADGFMVVEKAEGKADYKMLFYNSDGSMGEMCGNGARCICRYGYENGLAGEVQTIETTAGIVTGHRINQRMYRIKLNDPSVIELNQKACIDRKEYDYSYVELGNPGIPHIAVPIYGLKDFPERELFDLGRKLRYYDKFPKGANVNFYELVDDDHVYERTYERGVEDFTYACGTGTGSTVAILTLQEKVTGRKVKVDVTGGRLLVDIEIKGEGEGEGIESIYLTGPTNIVAKGEVTDEDLEPLL